jgi:autotransporter-associated beta strand protein
MFSPLFDIYPRSLLIAIAPLLSAVSSTLLASETIILEDRMNYGDSGALQAAWLPVTGNAPGLAASASFTNVTPLAGHSRTPGSGVFMALYNGARYRQLDSTLTGDWTLKVKVLHNAYGTGRAQSIYFLDETGTKGYGVTWWNMASVVANSGNGAVTIKKFNNQAWSTYGPGATLGSQADPQHPVTGFPVLATPDGNNQNTAVYDTAAWKDFLELTLTRDAASGELSLFANGVRVIQVVDKEFTSFRRVYVQGNNSGYFDDVRVFDGIAPAGEPLTWNAPGGGVWDRSPSNFAWKQETSPVAWSSGRSAIFPEPDAGPGGIPVTINPSYGALEAFRLEFAGDGYNLESSTPTGLTLLSGESSIVLGAGKSASLGAGLTLKGGAVFSIRGGGTVNLEGAVLDQESGATSRQFVISPAHLDQASVNLRGGRIMVGNGDPLNRVRFGSPSAGSGTAATLNLEAGLVSTPGFAVGGLTRSTIRFSGGATQSNLALAGEFLSGVSQILIAQGGAGISSGDWLGGHEVWISQPLRHDPSLGAFRDGGLRKQDFGTLVLSGENTYTGDTVVERGRLRLTRAMLGNEAAIKLYGSAELQLSFSGEDTVGAFYIGGEPQAPGLWGAPGSGAEHTSKRIIGPGMIRVTRAGAPENPVPPTANPLIIPPHPAAATIPDPLVTRSGQSVNSPAKWNDIRRGEILELFREHVYGRDTVERPADMTFTQVGDSVLVLNGTARKRQIRISYTGPLGGGSMNLYVYEPTAAKAKGLFLFINNRDADNVSNSTVNSFFCKDAIISRGYAALGIHNSELAPDNLTSGLTGGVFGVFGPRGSEGRPPDAWAAVAAWSWGASRAIDWIKTDPSLRDVPIAVAGHSRGGKASLWCGAQDTRVDLAISNSSGSTGAAIARTKGGERISGINENFPYWFCENYKAYDDNEADLPVDQHMLLALVAPRRVYVQSSLDDAHSDPTAEFESCLRAGPVFDLFGLKPVGARERPAANSPLHSGGIAYHVRGAPNNSNHTLNSYDWHRFMDYADLHWAGLVPSLYGWRQSHFLNREGAQDIEVPAGDGVPNLAKYALNMAPEGSSLLQPAKRMTPGGTAGLPAFWAEDGTLRFQHVRRKASTNPGVSYLVQSSSDLGIWVEVTAPASIESINTEWERVTYSLPPPGIGGQLYYRLRILAVASNAG